MKESDIQRACLDYLAARGVLAFRMNSGAMSGSHKGKRWFVKFGVPGMADVLAFVSPLGPGDELMAELPVWIEVKAPKGIQSDLQRSFQELVESHGHCYLLVRSLNELIEALSPSAG